MKISGLNLSGELNRILTRLLGMGNGLISHTGIPRYTTSRPGRAIRLDKGGLHTLPTERNLQELTVRSGIFWVTQEGDASDYLLKAGESLWLKPHGTIVIEALDSGAIELQET